MFPLTKREKNDSTEMPVAFAVQFSYTLLALLNALIN